MSSEGKSKGHAPQGAAERPLLERLKPEEAAAVLRRLAQCEFVAPGQSRL
jgi:hypothetical protein